MNCDSCELPKNAWITALTVRAFTRSSSVIRSGSLLMLIRSLMSRAMRDSPTENWFAISSPTERTRRLPRWSMSSVRSEEHTSELQSRLHLVCRLLLEKKKVQSLLLPCDRRDEAEEILVE